MHARARRSDGPHSGPVRRASERPRRWRHPFAALRPPVDEAPLVAGAPGMTLRQVVTRFWPWLRPLRVPLLLGFGLLAAAPLVEVAEVFLFQRLVDDVLVPRELQPLALIALVYVALNVTSAVISGIDDYLSTWISQRFLVSLRTDAFGHVLAQPQHIHDERRLGDVLTRLTSDVSAVERFMIAHLSETVGSSIRLVVYVVAMLVLSWELAIASLLVVPLFWWVSTRFARHVRAVSRERVRRGGSLGALAEEHLSNIPLIQAYGRQDAAVAAFHRQNVGVADAQLAASRVRSVFLPVVDLAELAGVLCVVAIGTWTLSTGRLTLGGLLGFLTLMAQAYRPVRSLSQVVPGLYSATAGAERISELLAEPPLQERSDAVDLVEPTGRVRFDAVTVRYPGAARDALRDVTFAAEPGEVVAVIGPSGAGKSTLLRLLTRGVEPTGGRVLLDGHDVDALTLASLRSAVTMVLQETLLLDASVADNIAFARPDATREAVEEAARAADAHSFISALPDGYDTRVGQRGRSLSGGQRQRVALARALLRGGPVLVLDEPTTGVDEASAERILAVVRAAAADRTVIVVTHDPVVLRFADRVVRLADGSVVAEVAA